MADSHSHAKEQSSVTTLIIITIILLSIIYFLAKGCTNNAENTAPASTHGKSATTTGH